MCCEDPKEPPHWGDSFEHPQHMFKLKDKKQITIVHLKNVAKLLCWPMHDMYVYSFEASH